MLIVFAHGILMVSTGAVIIISHLLTLKPAKARLEKRGRDIRRALDHPQENEERKDIDPYGNGLDDA